MGSQKLEDTVTEVSCASFIHFVFLHFVITSFFIL